MDLYDPISQRNYDVECEHPPCTKTATFCSLYDAYAEGWKNCPGGVHCPKHVTNDDWYCDCNMECAYCGSEGLYTCIEDAEYHGWTLFDEGDFCPDCHDVEHVSDDY